MRERKIKNPCAICGRATDTQGWCGASDHDAGNPFGGINCLTIPRDSKQPPNKEKVVTPDKLNSSPN